MGIRGYSAVMALLSTNLALALALSMASDVVIDMPPPPAVESAEVTANSKATLQRFAAREVAQDAAGNARSVNISRVTIEQIPGRYNSGGWDWTDNYNWGWPRYWSIWPMYWGGGWFGCSSYGGSWSGMSFGGSASVNMRLQSCGW